MWEWIREANRRGAGVGDGDLREMLGVLGAREPVRDAGAAPPEVVALADARAGRARGTATSRAPTSCAREIEALGWSVRDTPAAASSSRRSP